MITAAAAAADKLPFPQQYVSAGGAPSAAASRSGSSTTGLTVVKQRVELLQAQGRRQAAAGGVGVVHNQAAEVGKLALPQVIRAESVALQTGVGG